MTKPDWNAGGTTIPGSDPFAEDAPTTEPIAESVDEPMARSVAESVDGSVDAAAESVRSAETHGGRDECDQADQEDALFAPKASATRTPIRPLVAYDLERIREILYRESGIRIDAKKDYFLEARLQQRMEATGCSRFRQYLTLLGSPTGEEEIQSLIESVTINESYFFRDFEQLRGFGEEILPNYCRHKYMHANRYLRVWSAGCSTGEEAYTLSIILREMLDDYPAWDTLIEATDIDRNVLEKARVGVFSDWTMRGTPLVYREKYFRQVPDGWKVLPTVRAPIHFEYANLADPVPLERRRKFDFIFCRNVLIYFDDESRRRVVDFFHRMLEPGGYLFLGHAESVGRINSSFLPERVGEHFCYRRPTSNSTAGRKV